MSHQPLVLLHVTWIQGSVSLRSCNCSIVWSVPLHFAAATAAHLLPDFHDHVGLSLEELCQHRGNQRPATRLAQSFGFFAQQGFVK